MKNIRYAAALLGTLALAAVLGGCKHDSDLQPGVGTVTLEMENVAGTTAVKPDGTTVYTTAGGETFTVTTLKYYVSNVILTKADGSAYAVPGVYHLVDASKPATSEFTLPNVPTGDYSGLQFLVGVDSTATKADPLSLTGDLNPANNMYWAWNSGHVCWKLEGNVTSANNKAIVAHVGGFRQPKSALVSPKLGFGSSTLLVRADHAPEIHLTADVLKAFSGPNTFTLSDLPVMMEPGANAMKVAQNYGVGTNGAGMFTVAHIHAN